VAAPDAALLALAESVADGASVDWASAEASLGADDRAIVRELRILSELAALHRTMPVNSDQLRQARAVRHTTAAPAIGRWAHLDLIERLGGGTFGEVYRAWDRHLEREVALKLLRATETVDTDLSSSRIVTEGRMLARVHHPNIVAVHGVAVHEGRVGLWMELVSGQTLEQQLLTTGAMSAREASNVGVDLCRALAALHKAGLIHRDIKTQNVVREEGGRIVLMDFGTGRVVDPHRPYPLPDLAGTPLYLAPEILDGASASERTDLYSLGVLLYRLVTGAFPVRAATIDELREAHRQRRTVRLRDVRPDLPTAFVRVIDRAIALNPEERYASAGELEADLVDAADDRTAVRPTTVETIGTRRQVRVWWSAAAAAVLVLGVLAAITVPWRAALTGSTSASPAAVHSARISTIAVLPFQNLSTDPAEAFLASAVPMELTASLGKIGAVKVVPWTFMRRFDTRADRSLREVAQRTSAQAIIEGSVQMSPRSGDARRPVQVHVQVYEAGTGTLLWSEAFERDLGNFFALQVQIAKEVASRIHVVLATREQVQISRSRTVAPTAMEDYLNARYMMDVQTNIHGAIELLQRAIRIAPEFAEAFAALGSYYALENAYFGAVPSAVALRRALDASSRAIEIDPDLADAWAARAFARFALEWNWSAAESDFRHALELDPNSIEALWGYSDYLSDRGRHREALEMARRAEDRGPMSAQASRQVAWAYYLAHEYRDAINQLRRTLTIDPDYVPAKTLLARAQLLTGNTEEAIRTLQALEDSYPHMLALGYAISGRITEARTLVDRIQLSGYGGHEVTPYRLALVYVALHDVDRAVAALTAAYREKDASMTALAVDPMIDPIRDHSTVRALLSAMRLP
jgi:eukaryotic-like serine/threonine-protein kinase